MSHRIEFPQERVSSPFGPVEISADSSTEFELSSNAIACGGNRFGITLRFERKDGRWQPLEWDPGSISLVDESDEYEPDERDRFAKRAWSKVCAPLRALAIGWARKNETVLVRAGAQRFEKDFRIHRDAIRRVLSDCDDAATDLESAARDAAGDSRFRRMGEAIRTTAQEMNTLCGRLQKLEKEMTSIVRRKSNTAPAPKGEQPDLRIVKAA
jgi:hypothetical protein